jgi:hypothetical protein
MSDIPPKHAPDTSAYEPPETGGGLVAMYSAASHANAESFPVLKAFQDYLEAERAQARKRVVQLSVLFAVLMTVVVGGFLTAGIAMWRSNDQRVDKLLEAVIAQKTAPAPAPAPAVAPAPVPVPVVQTSPALEESVRLMSRATTELQSSMDKKLDGVNAIATKVHEKEASQDGELEKLHAELKQMKEQSAKLKDELVSIQAESKKTAVTAALNPAPAAPPPAALAPAPVLVPATAVASAPVAVAAAAVTPPAAPAEALRDPRFPPAVKEPPVTPAGVTPPPAPLGMMATAIPLKTKNVGTIPWRVLIPE